MGQALSVRFWEGVTPYSLRGVLIAAGSGARAALADAPGTRLLLTGDIDYAVRVVDPVDAALAGALAHHSGSRVWVTFDGRFPVRRRLEQVVAASSPVAASPVAASPAASPVAASRPVVTPVVAAPPQAQAGPALDLTSGIRGASPLFLLADGTFSDSPDHRVVGMGARAALVAAARWITSRRTSTFEQLFPPSAFHPEAAPRTERLSAQQGAALLDQVRASLAAAAVGGEEAQADAIGAAQVRSACLTVAAHLLATVTRDPSFRSVADAAAAVIFGLVQAEQGHPTARPALRAHAILALQRRGSALSAADRPRAATLLQTLIRSSPPYDQLTGPWRFAMCSGYEFHAGECNTLVRQHGFHEVPTPADLRGTPVPLERYRTFEAPFRTPAGEPIQICARSAGPGDENREMACPAFSGVFINRHAQLGSYDMVASTAPVRQQGYKLMLNSQCAGLTTRFVISGLFPDADIYSSWDSTFFRTGKDGEVTASEGLDCFVAILQGMSHAEPHVKLQERVRRAQWSHILGDSPDFVQFVGPAHPSVVARFSDVDHDGRADWYDGFLDFELKDLAEDIRDSGTPRDPGVAASAVGGAAAKGVGWAAGSMDRVTQYSDLWDGLPGDTERQYAFQGAGFYSHTEPPADVPTGKAPPQDLSRLPALCRFVREDGNAASFTVDVMVHSWLSHSAAEYKRLLCAAEAMWRAYDLGYLPKEGLRSTLRGQRGALLLMLAGLLEFPADANFIDGLWALALHALNLPVISRTAVRSCITEEDHDRSNYYGSERGLRQLLGDGTTPGVLERADPVAWAALGSEDPLVGRARELDLG